MHLSHNMNCSQFIFTFWGCVCVGIWRLPEKLSWRKMNLSWIQQSQVYQLIQENWSNLQHNKSKAAIRINNILHFKGKIYVPILAKKTLGFHKICSSFLRKFSTVSMMGVLLIIIAIGNHWEAWTIFLQSFHYRGAILQCPLHGATTTNKYADIMLKEDATLEITVNFCMIWEKRICDPRSEIELIVLLLASWNICC